MNRIVLVHGAWHGASCWRLLGAELAARGHAVVAVDLPSEQPGLGAVHYAEAVEAAVAPLAPSDRLVLVGHSLGGLTVPVLAQRLGPGRVGAMVLVGALTPQPGRSFDEQVRDDPAIMAPGFGRGQQRHDDRTTSWPAEAVASGLYRGVAAESSERVVADAAAGLRRQAWTVSREVTPLTAWPDVPTVVVVCREDQVVNPARSRDRVRELPGAELVEMPGGHFPMLTRPAELADVIAGVLPAES